MSNKTQSWVRTYAKKDPRLRSTVKRLNSINAVCLTDELFWEKKDVTVTVRNPNKKVIRLLEHLNFKKEQNSEV
jgi:hypothetical protein